MLGLAYQKIFKNLDNISINKIKDISNRLKNSLYKIGASRKVYIEKNKNLSKKVNKISSLPIMFFWDKVVAQAINFCLEYIFEQGYPKIEKDNEIENINKTRPIFLSCNHGFRSQRSCHSALHNIKT
jgi:retron-type reverse transcriptase